MAQNPLNMDAIVATTNNPLGLDVIKITQAGGAVAWRLRQNQAIWWTGSGAPTIGTADGVLSSNLYLDMTAGNLYSFDGTNWSQVPNPFPTIVNQQFIVDVSSPNPDNGDIEFISNNDPNHFQGIQVLGKNVNIDFPAIIIASRAPGSISLYSPTIDLNGGADTPGVINIGATGDAVNIGDGSGTTKINRVTVTAPANQATLTIADTKTFKVDNSLEFAGTDSTVMTFPSTSGTVVTTAATQTLTNKTLTSPTLTTPTLGVATATSVNKVTITAPATSATLTIADGKTLKADNSLEFAGTDATVMTFPSTSGTVVTLAATQTLTNKTLTTPTVTSIQGAVLKSQVFTSGGTFTIPAGITGVKFRVQGGGGAGGGGSASVNGSGGGSGGYAEKWLTGLTPGNTLAVTVGAGGAGASASNGGAGSLSSVASGTQSITTISAPGGNGGFFTAATSPGAAGTSAATGGDLNSAGSGGVLGTGGVGGTGAGSTFGGGGGGAGSGGFSGNAATGFGSGGGGSSSGSNTAGGAGFAGVVIAEWIN